MSIYKYQQKLYFESELIPQKTVRFLVWAVKLLQWPGEPPDVEVSGWSVSETRLSQFGCHWNCGWTQVRPQCWVHNSFDQKSTIKQSLTPPQCSFKAMVTSTTLIVVIWERENSPQQYMSGVNTILSPPPRRLKLMTESSNHSVDFCISPLRMDASFPSALPTRTNGGTTAELLTGHSSDDCRPFLHD